jgi:hypothetical protein
MNVVIPAACMPRFIPASPSQAVSGRVLVSQMAVRVGDA